MSLEQTFFDELSELALPVASAPLEPVTEAELAGLPEPARRYLRFMGVVGRPRDWSFRMHLRGRFRTRPDGAWKRCEIWQYNNGLSVSRVFYMRLRLAGVIPVVARDTYIDGHGHMVGKVLDRFTVVDGSGEAYDTGELVTYLDDLVLFAPSMLLRPEIAWTAVDSRSFDLEVRDRGNTASGRVFVEDDGRPVDFETTDRFYSGSNGPVRTRWTTPIVGFARLDGRRLPSSAKAVWHRPQGPFAYAELEIDPAGIEFNVGPAR